MPKPWSEKCPFYVVRFWTKVSFLVAGVPIESRSDISLHRHSHFILVSNHRSILDVGLLINQLPFLIIFLAKKELFSIPFLGYLLKLQGHRFVDRSNRRRTADSLARISESIQHGQSCMTFPEATRSQDGTLLPFKRGSFQLSTQSGIPILPCYLYGMEQVMAKGSFKIRHGRIGLKVGTPIELGDDQLKLTDREQQNWLMTEARSAIERLQQTI